MSDIEQVIIHTRRLEKLLRVQYHAKGRGLHQLVSSCEERLPHRIVGKLRFIATIRNKVVHEDGHRFERRQFLKACVECEKALTPRGNRFVWRIAIALMLVMTFAAASFYYIYWDSLLEHIDW